MLSNPNAQKRYTYADYLTWNDGKRWELIDGVPFEMQAAPSRRHQKTSSILFRAIQDVVEPKGCEAYYSPFDVRLKPHLSLVRDHPDDEITTVVEPDIVVFCDLEKLDDRGAIGAPDLVVEIVSPSSRERDKYDKLLLYQNSGVKEYWIVFPEEQIVDMFSLDQHGRYYLAGNFRAGDDIVSSLFEDLRVSTNLIFKEVNL